VDSPCLEFARHLREIVLATYPRKSKLYLAFRELGHVVRTSFLLEYLSDVELRRLIQSARNKSERFNQCLQWVTMC
jgi:TnpA family transposase